MNAWFRDKMVDDRITPEVRVYRKIRVRLSDYLRWQRAAEVRGVSCWTFVAAACNLAADAVLKDLE